MKAVKKEIRILGVDDAPFSKKDKKCLVVATIFRGGNYIDGLLSFYVDVDGKDATNKLIKTIKKTKHYDQLNCIMLNGIALAGFNVIDIVELAKKTKLPVIVVIRKVPDLVRIKKILRKIAKEKIKLLEKAGKIFLVKIRDKKIYIQVANIDVKRATEIVKISATHSLIPEPIRNAHLIASGIMLGESKGRV